MAKAGFEFDGKRLSRNIKSFRTDLRRNIGAVVDYNAAWAQTHLRLEAKWTDRTGAARSGLFAVSAQFGNSFEIFMAYSVNYGIWLEIANNRKYAVITPALRIVGEKLIRDMQYLIERMQ